MSKVTSIKQFAYRKQLERLRQSLDLRLESGDIEQDKADRLWAKWTDIYTKLEGGLL